MEDPIALTIRAKGRNKSGLRVEQRDDGHYYVSRVPRGFKGCAVGDRVLEINGISFARFKNESKANELIDTFQLQVIPIDNYDDGMETTDDDFDFGSDLEERAATVPSAGLMRSAPAKVSDNKNQRQNRAASSPKKGPGRRENVEYINDTDSEQEKAPNTSKNRATRAKSVPQAKEPPPKGPGRREAVEYLDDDDDTEAGAEGGATKSRNVPQAKDPPPKGPGRREAVEYLDDDDDDESGDKKSPPFKQPALSSKPGPGRREVVEHLDDDDDDTGDGADGGARKQPQSGGRRRDTVEYLDDDSEDEDIADDDTDDDEGYEEVPRQQSSGKPRHVAAGRQAAPAQADDDEVSEYDGDEESRQITEDDDDEEEDDDDDDDDDDEDYEQPQKPLSASSLRHSMARKQDSRRSLYRPPPEVFEREYTSDYKPLDRWMVTVHKEADEDVGISIVQYKKELFITGVDQGPFFKTAIDKGDKILSINGKKVGKHLSSVTEAEEIMEGKTQLTVFVLRPDNEKDLGYKWVMENC